jgi:arylsulfatase A-like enzyme
MGNHPADNNPCLSRRDFMKSAAAGAMAAGLPLSAWGAGKPNVLLIILDQMRLPCWFPKDAPIPAYDRLRSEGTAFANHYVSCVPCSASRASLFTGLHMDQHHVEVNVAKSPASPSNYSYGPELNPAIPTLGHAFQRAGTALLTWANGM